MGHVYAHADQLKQFMTGGDFGNDRDAALVTLLESASRAVDGFCKRGSGFGPVIETRTYTTKAARLRLQADVVEILTVTLGTTELEESDWTLENHRVLVGPWGIGSTVIVEMVTSYPFDTTPVTTLDGGIDDEVVEVTVDATDDLHLAQTCVVDDEQMLITAIDADTKKLTVVRAQNGTEAAAHLDEAGLSTYRYAAEATDGTLRIGQRRWKQRDAGLTGVFDGQGIPVTNHQDTEASILRMAVGHLRFGIVG